MDYSKFQIPKLKIHDWSHEKLPEEAFINFHPNYGDSLFETRYLGEFIYKEPQMDVYGNVKEEHDGIQTIR